LREGSARGRFREMGDGREVEPAAAAAVVVRDVR